ncbi:MAG: hypothetical protein KKE62_15665 [Proteobacteria bacterium]|nr:hypothetical protein [Pseudomonadota bacterium]MBU1387287.1 hypothetical protein [Pseudomonadota bacterium]MBU1544268.1 hypothetical protein [Pseudomonadota bacterium]MBU2429211.1 hypothetical protein [Pseudomonadota bacterium]MBU2481484.1 hypothetical protein [Pseudomonadota bacterium]
MGTSRPGDDDRLVFADPKKSEPEDSGLSAQKNNPPGYTLLIVDDEKEVHVMTKLVLSDYSYKGAGLQFFSAYSSDEAKTMIKEHPDAACILLDVVMETSDSGLEIARFIREDEKNELIRIILRTGQPGKAPEKEIILDYDINDYKEKTELTAQKLFTSITTALRSYRHLMELDNQRKEIAAKNVRLNEEIAKRIVAEHNLTKYNRSLEKLLDKKSTQLKTALQELELKEKELHDASTLCAIGDVSSASLSQLDLPRQKLEQNLEIINQYRTQITLLLEKYEVFQEIICSSIPRLDSLSQTAQDSIKDLDRLKQDMQLEDILARYPEIIDDSANGLTCISNVINDIKLFITLNDSPEEISDMNSILKSSIKKLENHFDKRIDLQSNFNDLPRINIAAQNMEKACFEIIKNAYEAAGLQGIISISTEYDAPDIVIHISDIGCGIPPEDQTRIFKPYFTKNKPPAAKGLGLFFANAVVKNAGGTIEVTSKPNEGTTVIVMLPVDRQHALISAEN